MKDSERTLLMVTLLCTLFTRTVSLHAQTGYLSNDQITSTALNASDRHAVVLIHGWTNAEPQNAPQDMYTGDWMLLREALMGRLNGTGTKLLLFHWERDASTGHMLDCDSDLECSFQLALSPIAFNNAATAAANGFLNGDALSGRLNQLAPDLRRATFIAHSAGSWVAHRAADKLLQANPYVVVNVVLLDPFIPGVNLDLSTPLTTARMGELDNHASADRIYRLENYYTIDYGTDTFNAGAGWDARATSQTFPWRSLDINNHRVDHLNYYWGHTGPIEFYADTVIADTPGGTVSNGLARAPWDFTTVGFFRGLVYESFLLPALSAQPQAPTQPVTAGSPVTLSVTANRAVSYQWFKNGQTYPSTSSSLTFNAVSVADAGTYVVRVGNSAGYTFSEKTALQVASPQAPAMTTAAASGIQATSAVLNGTVNANGFSTTTVFEYGPTTAYGSTVAAQAASGSNVQSISATASGLSCSAQYHFRAKGTSSAGTGYGSDRMFTTSSCSGSSGTCSNPIAVSSFPYTDSNTTVGKGSNLNGYSIPPASGSEAGPEVVYRVTVPSRGVLSVTVTDGSGVDIDPHLLSSCNPSACLARADATLGYAVDAGTYYIVCDTFTNSSGTQFPGGYTMTASFTPSGGGSDCYSLSLHESPSSGGETEVDTNWNCEDGYTSGTAVRIIASADDDYEFSHWTSSNCTLQDSDDESTTCTMTGGNASATAHFTSDPAPEPCTSYTINPTSHSPNAEAGQQTVTVTGVPSGCEFGGWRTGWDLPWLSAPITGPKTVTVSWTSNPGPARTGTADIADNTFTVHQAGTLPGALPYVQQGPKLVAASSISEDRQGNSVALSADGTTALVGAPGDGTDGAVYAWTRNAGVWTQQGPKWVGPDSAFAYQGFSVSLSADGNTAVVGGFSDSGFKGAAWIWTRSGATWTPQSKLFATDAVGNAYQGYSVAISADAGTVIVGGPRDGGFQGAAWVWTRNGAAWTLQQKLTASDIGSDSLAGDSVALSADGNTAIVGGHGDDDYRGAAWVWTRSGGVWTRQGPKLVGTGSSEIAQQGVSVALSADGNTAIVGGYADDVQTGAAWVWTRNGVTWSEQLPKLVAGDHEGESEQGQSVALSADGNTAMVGGSGDDGHAGAAWIWTRSGGVWTTAPKLVGSGGSAEAYQGASVALSANGTTAIVGGFGDDDKRGAAWVFVDPVSAQPPAAPGSVAATAVSSTRVEVSWGLAQNATSYRIDRKGAGGAFVQIGTSATNTFADTTASADSAYLYRVRAANDGGVSPASAPDLATTVAFADSPLSGGTAVKAVHLAQLRTAVNAVRLLAGLTATSFIDAAAYGVPIRAVHVTELRSSLDAARGALGLATGGYTSDVLNGSIIKAVHLQELRNQAR